MPTTIPCGAVGVAALLLASAIAGCITDADFRLAAENRTPSEVDVEVSFREGNDTVEERTFHLAAGVKDWNASVRLPHGIYEIVAAGNGLKANRTHEFGNSVLGVEVVIHAERIDIIISEV